MSFFQKLYEGKYMPIQEQTPDTEEYNRQWSVMSEAEEELRKTLTMEQLKLFQIHQEAQTEIESILHVQSFQQGFRIGVEFQKEFFNETDHLQCIK